MLVYVVWVLVIGSFACDTARMLLLFVCDCWFVLKLLVGLMLRLVVLFVLLCISRFGLLGWWFVCYC